MTCPVPTYTERKVNLAQASVPHILRHESYPKSFACGMSGCRMPLLSVMSNADPPIADALPVRVVSFDDTVGFGQNHLRNRHSYLPIEYKFQ